MMVELTIDDKKIKVEPDKSVIEAAEQAGIYIPSLCYHPDLSPIGSCRLCIVEIEGMRGVPTACTTAVKDGMIVHTNTPKVKELREKIIWLLLSEYPEMPDKNSQFGKVVEWVGKKEILPGYKPERKIHPVISNEPLFDRDINRCILCGRCVKICSEARGVGAIGFVNRGIDTIVGTDFNVSIRDSECKFCGACVEVCPSGALTDKKEVGEEEREEKLVPCRYACPAGINIPRYVKLISEGKFQDALEVIRERVPFPHVLGCVCDHPCEEVCRRCDLNEPVSIKNLKRFVAERDTGRWRSKITIAPDTGKKVAIIGSGPAGLTAAWYLRKLGHAVTVFEALQEMGGMMRTGIPGYRLPAEILNKEIQDIINIGITVKLNAKIDSLDKLFMEGFDSIFLSLGATGATKMKLEGEDNRLVLDGISMLKNVRLSKDPGIKGKVAVVGGGNVAIDVARTSLRVGAEKVTVLYRRTRNEMPANAEEIEDALQEGIKIEFLVAPKKIVPKENSLKIECIRMELGEPDESGRRRPVPVEGSDFTIEADRLIGAIGQRAEIPDGFAIKTERWGTIVVDPQTLSSSRDGVFSGGDVVSGPANVIGAIQHGRIAACSIDKYLGGDGNIDEKYIPDEEDDPYLGREEGFADKSKATMPVLPVKKRIGDFSQVELGLEEKAAVEEAKRCLQCQLRLNINKPPMPK